MSFPSLKRRSDFETFRNGRSHLPSVEGKYIRIAWKPSDSGVLLGFKVNRYTGNAVRRNRIKRILRSCDFDLPSAHYLIIVKSRVRELSDRKLSTILRTEIKRLNKSIKARL